jgi:hypothetical protein
MSEPAAVKLHFEDSGDWYSLPDWAEYFISIGKDLAAARQSDSRIVTAIVVPTRAFGAAFVSLGMVISDAAARDHESVAAHFANLLEFPPGKPVIYRPRPRKTLKGVLEKPEELNGQWYVRVQVHSHVRSWSRDDGPRSLNWNRRISPKHAQLPSITGCPRNAFGPARSKILSRFR